MPKVARCTLMALLLATAACGGSDAGEDRGTADDSPLGGPPVGDTGSHDIQPLDTGAWMVDPGTAPVTEPDAPPTGGTGPTPRPAPGPAPDGWTSGESAGGSGSGVATLVAVRSARQDGYDRVVFEFDPLVPRYRIEYVDSPQQECGSGEAVRVAGDGWLQVSLEPANAHTEAGQPTAPRRIADPPGDNLLELRRICDFEAHVTWVLGVASPNPYRVLVLSGPARLVVDVRQ